MHTQMMRGGRNKFQSKYNFICFINLECGIPMCLDSVVPQLQSPAGCYQSFISVKCATNYYEKH